jgi:GNAT superfamily N-acetyltransferase
MVSIRHATSADLVRVEGRLRRLHEDSELVNAEVAVASEDERLIGFGILRKEKDGGCVSLFEDGRRKGIGVYIVKHLLEYAEIEALPNAQGELKARYFSNTAPWHPPVPAGVKSVSSRPCTPATQS